MNNTLDFITANKSFSGTDMVAMCQMTGPNGEKSTYTLGSLQTLTYSIHMDRRPIRSIGNINAKDYVMGPRTIAGSLIFAVFNKHFAYEAMEDIRKKYDSRYAFLADELPPFDITISFANEYGAQAKLVLYGVRLVNEGQVMSVNDIYTENTYQFVATDIEYLTDVNGYASSMNIANGNIISKSEDVKDSNIGKEIRDKIQNPSTDKSPKKIELLIETISPQIGDKNGIVKLQLSPQQDYGTIVIKGKSLLSNIEMDIAEYKGQPIYLSLPSNKYSAQYKDVDNDKYSNEKEFSVGWTNYTVSNVQPAPLIEYVTDRKISIYSNVPQHNKLRFALIPESGDPVFNEVSLQGRRATIEGLLPGTAYVFYTCDNNSVSLRAYGKTEYFYEQPYEDLKSFILFNRNQLRYGKVEDYIRIIDIAKEIALESKYNITPSIAIVIHKDRNQRELINLNINSFKSYDNYISTRNKLENEILTCGYLLIPANMLENDGVISMNPPEETSVKPPMPELMDAINCTFILDGEIERLEFYRQYSHTAQFAIEVKKISFFNYMDGKSGFKFYGKPGVNHYVYAFDKMGHRSAKVNFYVMTDAEKEIELEAYNKEHDAILKAFTEKEREVGSELNQMDLKPESRKRILVEEIKVPDVAILTSPTITNIQKDKVIIDVSYKESLGNYIKDFYVAIASVDNALFKRSVYKKRIDSGIVEFTTRHGGIRPDMQYAVWIENDQGEQISTCSTFATYSVITDTTTLEEDKIKIRENTIILNKIKANIANKVATSDEISACIENLKEDTILSWDNVFDKIAQNFMNYTPKILNTDQLIRALYEVKADILHRTDLMFFSNAVFNPKDYTIKLSERTEDFMLTIHYINIDSSEIKTSRLFADQENVVSLNKTSRYIVVYAVAPDIYTKSGMIIIDTITNKVSGYKIMIGG